jgi:phenylalanyl-tRNA synthetase beta chain
MKISFNWLRELCDLPPGVTAAAVAERLTLAGLEVEAIERRGRDVQGVQVAEVRGVRPHPGAEKLRLVRVRVRAEAGAPEDEVVCGAPNVPEAGALVAWAPPGASLPGGRTLDRREIRGVVSPGMLCSETELGIGEASDGIIVLPRSSVSLGVDVAGALGLLDEVLDVNVTPNRPDALSHAGVAREVAALFRTHWRLPRPDAVAPAPVPQGRGIDVEIRDPVACPRYTARIISGLRVAESPLAMRIRLTACGVRAISNLVDVTNYVMLETGHPLHAFDLEKVSGGIVVRRANRAERMTTLDGVERPLQEGDVVIADGRGAIALAGVMGGASSEVSDGTTSVLLEAATFDPRSVRRTAKRLGLHSEASHRFERSVDANGLPYASQRAAAMLALLGGGVVNGEPVDRYPLQQHPRKVALSMAGLARTAGYEIPLAQAVEKLASIDIPVELTGEGLTATVPSFRPDLSIEPDLIEEVMRLCGYDRVPARLPPGARAPATSPETLADRARDALAAQGLHEAATWGFVPRPWLKGLGKGRQGRPLDDGIAVKNPISSDYEVMRTSLFPGLADAARRNLQNGAADVALFEVGPVVIRGADAKEHSTEPTFAAGLLVGRRPDWLKPGPALDFFDAKRVVDELLGALGIGEASYLSLATPAALAAPAALAGLAAFVAPTPVGGGDTGILHPGISARVFSGPQGSGREVGLVGVVHPAQRKRFGLEDPALYFEIELDAVAGERRAPKIVSPPRFPAATRDVSFWIGAEVTAAAQRAAMTAVVEPLLRELTVLEDFRDPRHVAAGKKGMLWTMTYRAPDRTLTDAEVDAAHAGVVAALAAKHAIEIR